MPRKKLKPLSVEELVASARFHSLEQIAAKAFEQLTPAIRLSVAEAAEQYMRFGSGSGHSFPWSPAKTPYRSEEHTSELQSRSS